MYDEYRYQIKMKGVVTRKFRDSNVISRTPIHPSFQYLESGIRPLRMATSEEGSNLPYELAVRIYAESIAGRTEGNNQRRIFSDMLRYNATAQVARDLGKAIEPLIYNTQFSTVSLEYFSETVGNLQSVVKGAFVTIGTKQEAQDVPVMRECCYYIPHYIRDINGRQGTVSSYEERILTIYERSAKLYGYSSVKHTYLTSNDLSVFFKYWYPIHVHGDKILDAGVHEPIITYNDGIKYNDPSTKPSYFIAPKLAALVQTFSGHAPLIHIRRGMDVYKYPRSATLQGLILTGARLRFYQLVEEAAKNRSIDNPEVIKFLTVCRGYIERGTWPVLINSFMRPGLSIWNIGVVAGIFGETLSKDPCRKFYMSEGANDAIGGVAFSSDVANEADRVSATANIYHNLGADAPELCDHYSMDYTGFDNRMKHALIRGVLTGSYAKAGFLDIIMPK